MSKDPNTPRNRLAPAPTTRGRNRFGLPGSLLLHAAIVGGALFTWQHHYAFPDVSPPVVPVELVTIADKTNIKQVAPEPAFKPKPEQPIQAQQPVDSPPPLPQQMEAPAVPIPVEPEKQIAQAQPQLEAKAPAIEMKAPPPPKVVPHRRPEPPKPKPVEKKKQKFDINNVLALLDKKQTAASSAKGVTGAHPHRGFGAQNAMTMELADALRNQIAQCWSPPAGAPRPVVVEFELYLSPDGSIARPPQLSGQSQGAIGDPFVRAFAEAARRAIYECAPYHLPQNRYSDWRDIDLTFDPRQMMGGQ